MADIETFTIERQLGNSMLTTEHGDMVLIMPSDVMIGLTAEHRHGSKNPPVLLSLAESEALIKLLGAANAKIRARNARG